MMAAEKTSAPTGIEALKKWNQQHPDCTTPWSDDRRRRSEIQRLRDLAPGGGAVKLPKK